MRELVSLAREYRRLTRELEDVRSMLSEESDQELAAMAREELAQLEESLEGVEADLRVALLPRDPNDAKNVVIEIRAGTGGDEAGLFAGRPIPPLLQVRAAQGVEDRGRGRQQHRPWRHQGDRLPAQGGGRL